jgi:hypothetical protein
LLEQTTVRQSMSVNVPRKNRHRVWCLLGCHGMRFIAGGAGSEPF